MRLGEQLIADAVIDENQLENAVEKQARYGGKLGEWLVHTRALSPLQLLQRIAAQEKRPFAKLQHTPPNATLLEREKLSDYVTRHYLPLRREENTLIIACADTALEGVLRQEYQQPIRLVYATPRDIRSALEAQFGASLVHECQTQILREAPHYSASYRMSPEQTATLILLGLSLTALWIIAPATLLVAALAVINVLYAVTLGFKYWLLRQTPRTKIGENVSAISDQLDASELPIYSILVPLYREEHGVSQLLNAIRALDYPKHKLDVKLVIEADDKATFAAIKRANPEPYFDVIRVPEGGPRTKPKACSYALHFVRGAYVTIYDAEDRPEPSQLKKAVAAFAAAQHHRRPVICLQARLNYYNYNESWLTRCFALEYGSLFDIMLPGLERLGIPIPLGGTSNHIHLAKLRELYDWDPYNVTEDADLGMRMATRGYRTQMLDSITLEEAPIRFGAWLKQRSRWIKGYMQTWLVYMRRPRMLHRQLGRRGFWGFQLMIGVPCLVFLLSPLFWTLSVMWLIGALNNPLSGAMILVGYGLFFAGYACHFIYAQRVIAQLGLRDIGKTAYSYPFYWFCHSLASLKALWQLARKPFYWEKTQHSVSQQLPTDSRTLFQEWQKAA